MVEEKILSGYCRTMDQNRMVIAVSEEGKITEVDCDFPGCPHSQSCSIAAQLKN